MSKRLRTLLAILGIAGLLIAGVAFRPSTTSAANLTGGNYTYLVNGEEMTFTFDPIAMKGGLLLPFEVFQQFGVTMNGGQQRDFTLSKDSVTVRATVGSTTITVNDNAQSVSTAPVRLNGRIFIPSDVLQAFGVEFSQDGNYVSLRTSVSSLSDATKLSDIDFNILRQSRGVLSVSVKADSGSYMVADFLLLNADLINSANLGLPYGVRAQLLGRLQTNTLVYVKLSNYSNKAGGLATAGTYLVDSLGHQYDVQNVLDIGSGLLSGKLVPGANRAGVLVYNKVASMATGLTLYYDANGSELGRFPSAQ
jgi:hypothetical protein